MPEEYGLGGGVLQGIGNALVEREKQNLAQSQQMRANLWALHQGIGQDPSATPETRMRALQNLGRIATLKPHDKIPKELTDVSLYMAPPPGYGQQAPSAPPDAFTVSGEPVPSGAPPASVPGVGLHGAGMGGGATGQSIPQPGPGFAPPQYSMQTQSTGEPLAGMSPFAAPTPPAYAPFYTPEEQGQMAAAATSAKTGADERAKLAALGDAVKELRHNGGTDADVALMLGHALPAGLYTPHKIGSGGVLGADLIKSNPGITTAAGVPPDPQQHYDAYTIGDNMYAFPAGASAEKILADISDSHARADWYKARTAQIPYQTAKIIQDMDLNPEKVEISRANAAARWFGPAPASRQSAQYGGDVEDKIDNIEPLVATLAKNGKVSALQGRWEQIWTDKVRAGDPEFANLGTQMDVLAYAVQRMHGFRNVEQARAFINERLNEASDPEQLIGSLEGLRTAARTYESMGQFPPEVQAQMQKALTHGNAVAPKGTERLPPTAPGAPPPPLSAKGAATPGTHQWSISAWQRANPTGDSAAAKAAAQKAGYEVVP